MAPFNQRNNTGSFDGLVHHCYMKWLAICALIKHIFKTFSQRDKNSIAKYFISVHKETLALKCTSEIQDKK